MSLQIAVPLKTEQKVPKVEVIMSIHCLLKELFSSNYIEVTGSSPPVICRNY